MSIVVPMAWRVVPPGAQWIDSDGNVNTICCWRDSSTRYLWTDAPHEHYRYTGTPPDDVVPVIVASDAELIGAAVVTLINAGFTVEPIPEQL
jgi:hypothetical protein